MRIGLFLLLFPSLVLAIGGCPVGVQLGNVTMATRLPVCLKFEGSEHGGCLVDCKGVCVELPLANTKGPVETTGTTCSWSDSNGSGNGDADGSGNTPSEGSSGTKPIDGWLDFQPVIGDATGTSVSAAVAKLNKNLGGALRQVVDGNRQDSANLNSIAHSAESIAKDMKTSLYYLDRMAGDVFSAKTSSGYLLEKANIANGHLDSIASKIGDSGSGSDSDSGSTGGNSDAEISKKLSEIVGKMDRSYYGAELNTSNHLGNMISEVAGIRGALAENGMSGNIYAIRQMMEKMSSGAADGGPGAAIDYSKMPGSEQSPLHVASANYDSNLCKDDAKCFFDLAAINKKFDDAKGRFTDTYDGVKKEMADMFHYSFSGSAAVPKCFDMFSMFGRSYSVCPEVEGYWEMIAAIMMFIFYFLALMIVAKR